MTRKSFWTPASAVSDSDAIHDNVAGEIAAITEKASPVSADLLLIEDSAASNAKKRVQVGNLSGTGGTGAINTITPTLEAVTTNPTLGTGGIAEGWWIRNGHVIHLWCFFQFGTSGTNAGSGIYQVALPVTCTHGRASGAPGAAQVIGVGTMRNNSGSFFREEVGVFLSTSGYVRFLTEDSTSRMIEHNRPFSWTTEEALSFQVTYIAEDT